MRNFKIAFLITLNLIFAHQITSQITLNQDEIDSINLYNYELGQEIWAVHTLNQIIKSENITDTVSIFKKNKRILYQFKHTIIENILHSYKNNSPVQLDYGSRHSPYLNATIEIDDSNQIIITMTKIDSCKKIKIARYKNSVLNGQFQEKCKEGEIFNQGSYKQIDSIYLDTISLINMDNYEVIMEINTREKYPVKCGEWILQTQNGIETKVFEPCR